MHIAFSSSENELFVFLSKYNAGTPLPQNKHKHISMETSADSDKTATATTTNTLQVPQTLPPQKNQTTEKKFL